MENASAVTHIGESVCEPTPVRAVRKSRSAPRSREKAFPLHDPLHAYLLEIEQYQLLTREEEVELATLVKEKQDERAAHNLVTSNLRLVVKIAMGYHRYWTENLLDLIQEGNLGLIQAVKKYDPHRGIKFSYYASFWIKAYMLKFIMDNWKLVKIGTTESQRKLFFNLAKERDRLVAEGFSPRPGILAKRLNVKEEEVVEMSQRLEGWELSLSAPVGDDSKESYGAFLPDPTSDIDELISDEQLRQILAEKLRNFRGRLTEREADIFDNRIMAEKPLILQDLGDKYHISRERVRQIQKEIISSIKKWSQKEIPNFEEEYSELLN